MNAPRFHLAPSRSMARAVTVLLAAFVLRVVSSNPASAEDRPEYLLSWGSGGSGDGQFNNPLDIAVSADGFVYVADTGNDRIQKFTTEGVFVLKWGSPGAGPGQFGNASGVAVDPVSNVYVAGNARIQKFDADGNFIGSWSNPTPTAAFVNVGGDPFGAFIYGVSGPDSLIKFTADGTRVLGWKVPLQSVFSYVWEVAVGPLGHAHVTVPRDNKVFKYLNGSLVSSWTGTGEGQLDFPMGIAVDANNDVYVADVHWVRKFTASGSFLTRWGTKAA